MTLRLSTGLRNQMLGLTNPTVSLIAADTIAFVDGGASEDTITDSGSGFITAGFKTGDTIYIAGTTSNDTTTGITLTGVTAGTLTVATGTLTAESAGTVFAIASAKGGSLADILQNGVIKIYSGSQPATADTAASGTHLLTITVSSGSFTPGTETNGLEFDASASGEIEKASAETWSGVGLADGTAGWFRFYANATDAGGASTTLPRIDGSISTSGADLNMSSTSIVTDASYTIDSFKFTFPYQYGA